MTGTDHLFNNLIEAAKKNRKGLIRLKNAIVTLQQYELAAQIRGIEKEAFPETEEVTEAKKYAHEIHLAFQMVELNVSNHLCWLIGETLKIHTEKKGDFSIEDAVKLRLKMEEIFITEES